MSKVDDVKASNDFRDVAYRLVGERTGKGTGFTQHACLFCQSSDAFTVYEDSFYCYSCGKHGDVIDLLAFENNQTVSDFLRGNQIQMSPQEIEQRRAEVAERERVRAEEAERNYQNALERLHETRAWIRYAENLRNNQNAQQLWRARGIPNEWQAYFELGYSPNFRYETKQGIVTTPTLTIPVKKTGGEVVTIRHRLLNVIGGNKYRPERQGLKSEVFVCNTELKNADWLAIIEGEIKSMVSFITYDKRGHQFVGVPSKGMMAKTIRQAKGRKNVIVIPDPDSAKEIAPVCKETGARFLVLPDKIDDWILSEGITTNELRYIFKQARIL